MMEWFFAFGSLLLAYLLLAGCAIVFFAFMALVLWACS